MKEINDDGQLSLTRAVEFLHANPNWIQALKGLVPEQQFDPFDQSINIGYRPDKKSEFTLKFRRDDILWEWARDDKLERGDKSDIEKLQAYMSDAIKRRVKDLELQKGKQQADRQLLATTPEGSITDELAVEVKGWWSQTLKTLKIIGFGFLAFFAIMLVVYFLG